VGVDRRVEVGRAVTDHGDAAGALRNREGELEQRLPVGDAVGVSLAVVAGEVLRPSSALCALRSEPLLYF